MRYEPLGRTIGACVSTAIGVTFKSKSRSLVTTYVVLTTAVSSSHTSLKIYYAALLGGRVTHCIPSFCSSVFLSHTSSL